jgi:hypothetical protein
MKCENCGYDNPPDLKFCENCGNILTLEEPAAQPAAPEQPAPEPAPEMKECPNCKQMNPADATFCDGCGASLQPEAEAAPEEPAPEAAPAAPVEEPPAAEPAPEEPAPAPAAVAVTKVLVLPGDAEIVLDAKKTFGRIDFAKQASQPMWISRQHFTVFEEDGVSYIQDEGSSNGTKLNGKEIKLAGKQELKSGDEIIVGDAVKVIFKIK